MPSRIAPGQLAEASSQASASTSKILDVGCGQNKYPGAIGIDSNPRANADVIHDLGVLPYPFPDNEFDLIICRHVIEHVPDVMSFVSELHRISKPAGLIKIVTPHYSNPDWATDPTHRNHFNHLVIRIRIQIHQHRPRVSAHSFVKCPVYRVSISRPRRHDYCSSSAAQSAFFQAQ